jgi:predicted nucleic acid-binding Zn ribbon protein
MPLYQYTCREGHRKTLLRQINARDDLVYCVEIHDGPDETLMQRTFAPPSVAFKGRGVTRGSEAYGRATPAAEQPKSGSPVDPHTS